MKKLLKKNLVIGLLILTSNAFAQIPVTDIAQITSNITAQAETMVEWATQAQNMMAQIEEMQKEYDALTGSRNMGTILNNPELRDYLPSDWQTVYDGVKNGGYAGLTGRGEEVYNNNKIYDGCAFITIDEQRIACEARAVKASQDKGFALDSYDKAKSRIAQIDQLMAKINTTDDPKAIAELQARIAAEQANIQNEQTKLQLYSMVAAAEDRVQRQRERELHMKETAKRELLNGEPMTFSLRP